MSWRSFWEGFGSVLDIFGTNIPETAEERLERLGIPKDGFAEDAEKLKQDWEKVVDASRTNPRVH